MTPLSRRPPPVQYPVQRSVVVGMALGGCLLVSAAVLVAWGLRGAGPSWVPIFIAGCLWLCAAAGAWHFWRHQFVGLLRWDGHVWALENLTQGGLSWALIYPPEVQLDMQTQLWVAVSPEGSRRIWLLLGRSSQPERWLDLRRAVYSRARPGTDNADEFAPASSRGPES